MTPTPAGETSAAHILDASGADVYIIGFRKYAFWAGMAPMPINPSRLQRPRLTAFFSSAPAENLVTFLAAIFNGVPVCGFLPVRAFLELTMNVPNPTSVTFPPRFNVATTPSIVEFNALPAWTFEIFASFAIFSINSPLFIVVCLLLRVLLTIFYECTAGLYMSARKTVNCVLSPEMQDWRGIAKMKAGSSLTKSAT
jgi:hypothetical protein